MRVAAAGLLLIAMASGGCHRATPDVGADGHRARYAGIGLYAPDHRWANVDGTAKPADAAQATTADDTTVIVTIDGATGEIRQCGNYSGHCIGSNPWHGGLGDKQRAPVSFASRDEPAGNDTVAASEPGSNTVQPAKK